MMSTWHPYGVSHRPHGATNPFFADPFEVRARNWRR
jgi:hypothetical protein